MNTAGEIRGRDGQAQVTPEQEIRTEVPSRVLPRARTILVSVGIGAVLLVGLGSITLLNRAHEKIAVLEERSGAFKALQIRGERERRIRRWIISQNPKALMVDFDQLPGVLLDEATEHDLDYRVVMAVIQKESQWQPDAVGSDGEIGLMQMRPDTAARVAEKLGIEFVPPKRNGRGGYANLGSLRDPSINIRVGMAYLREQIEEFGMQPEALQAYNRGPRRARRTWPWDSYAADVARNFGALVLWEGFPGVAEREGGPRRPPAPRR